jgi:hypothetical protein
VLIDEIRDRFPTALRIATRSRGEMGIVATPPHPRTRLLVDRCLEAFAPWGMSCTGHGQDDLRLMHVILHPPCFRARVTALGSPDPLPRLQVPRFDVRDPSIEDTDAAQLAEAEKHARGIGLLG